MIPEPLVNIRAYQAEDEAYADLAELHARGIVAYVLVSKGKGGDGSIRLRVPQSVVTEALEALGPAPESAAGQSVNDPYGEYACPRCRSTRSKALPPYYLIALGASVLGATWLGATSQFLWLAGLAVVALPALHQIEWHAPHWRCLNCGHAWNQEAERRKRADARRNTID